MFEPSKKPATELKIAAKKKRILKHSTQKNPTSTDLNNQCINGHVMVKMQTPKKQIPKSV